MLIIVFPSFLLHFLSTSFIQNHMKIYNFRLFVGLQQVSYKPCRHSRGLDYMEILVQHPLKLKQKDKIEQFQLRLVKEKETEVVLWFEFKIYNRRENHFLIILFRQSPLSLEYKLCLNRLRTKP
jgi:hypothetical protein